MHMSFYQSLQMDPSVLKKRIAQCETVREKTFYWTAIAIRSVLIVAFAIVFISLLSGLFRAGKHALGSGCILYYVGNPLC